MTNYGRMRIPGKVDSAAVSSAAGNYRDAVLALNPVRFWLMTETAGTSLADTGSAASAATVNNGGVVGSSGGPFGTFVDLNGTNNYISATSTSLMGEWSAVALVRVDTQADSQIVGCWGAGGSQNWILGLTATGIEAYVYSGGYSGFGKTATLTGGAWKYVGVSRRAGTNASSLYVGSSETAGTIAAAGTSGTALEIGRKGLSGSYLDGGVCGVAVFSSALTTAQHLALATAAGLN